MIAPDVFGPDMALTDFQRYCQEAGQYPLLTAEDERELAQRYQRGDRAAGQWLVCCNLRLVLAEIEGHRTNARIDILDLVQQANIGLLRAVQQYNPERGYRFSTYTVPAIRARINRYWDEESRAVHLPQHVLIAHRVESRGEPLTKHRRPLEAARPWLMAECASLDVPIEGRDSEMGSYGDLMEDPHAEEAFEQVLLRAEMAPLLARLPARWREVLELLYGFREVNEEHTYTSLGLRFGVSKTRIQQIERQALDLLRKEAEKQGATSGGQTSWVSKNDPNYVSVAEAARLADCTDATCMQIIRRCALPLHRVEGRSRRVLARADVPRIQAAVCREEQRRARGRAAS